MLGFDMYIRHMNDYPINSEIERGIESAKSRGSF